MVVHHLLDRSSQQQQQRQHRHRPRRRTIHAVVLTHWRAALASIGLLTASVALVSLSSAHRLAGPTAADGGGRRDGPSSLNLAATAAAAAPRQVAVAPSGVDKSGSGAVTSSIPAVAAAGPGEVGGGAGGVRALVKGHAKRGRHQVVDLRRTTQKPPTDDGVEDDRFPPLDAPLPAYKAPSRPFERPSWCEVSSSQQQQQQSQQQRSKDYDSVGTWLKDWISSHDCAHDAQVQWDAGATPSTSFALALYDIASRPEVTLAFEVGAFRGCGSTLVLSKAMLDNGGCLVSFEVDRQYKERAAANTAGLPARFEFGCMGGADGIRPRSPDAEQLVKLSGPRVTDPSPEWTVAWEGEKELCRRTEAETGRRTFEDLCRTYDFVLGLFDGGEYYGESEFLSAVTHCLSLKYVALDDIDIMKNWRNYHRLLRPGSGWVPVYDSHAAGMPGGHRMKTRYGWAIFQREGM